MAHLCGFKWTAKIQITVQYGPQSVTVPNSNQIVLKCKLFSFVDSGQSLHIWHTQALPLSDTLTGGRRKTTSSHGYLKWFLNASMDRSWQGLSLFKCWRYCTLVDLMTSPFLKARGSLIPVEFTIDIFVCRVACNTIMLACKWVKIGLKFKSWIRNLNWYFQDEVGFIVKE